MWYVDVNNTYHIIILDQWLIVHHIYLIHECICCKVYAFEIHNACAMFFMHVTCTCAVCVSPRTATNPNIQSMKKVADLYAEVIGILSQSRFHSVRRRFLLEIRDPQNSSSTTINIIEGMSFIRVKMFPVEELEQWFSFLQVGKPSRTNVKI